MVGTVQIDRLVSLTGHASVSTRKGNKKVCLYDLTVTLAWSGTPPDTGDDVSKGEVTLKEFATENDEDEYLWEGKADTKGPGADEMLKGVLSLRAVVVQRLLEAVELMKDV
jgi:activator of HSP90 ATPase